MKKVISLFVSMLFIFNLAIPVFAQDSAESNVENSVEFVVPVYDSVEEYQQALSNEPDSIASSSATELKMSVIRLKEGEEECELILRWSGTDVYSAWKFKQFKVYDANLLFPDRLIDTLGFKSSYTTKELQFPTAVGSRLMGNVYIDIDLTEVRVKCTGIQAYNMTTQSWLSATVWGNNVAIKMN